MAELDPVRNSSAYKEAVEAENRKAALEEELADQAAKQARQQLGPLAARVTDVVLHVSPVNPGTLTIGPGSPNVLINNLPAWRALPLEASAKLQAAKQKSQKAIAEAEAAQKVAEKSYPALAGAAKAYADTKKAEEKLAMGNAIRQTAAQGVDIHTCLMPPGHGVGSVINASKTVLINKLPASRLGDKILEASGSSNVIVNGCPTVLIGD